jgi:hypothetical protein
MARSLQVMLLAAFLLVLGISAGCSKGKSSGGPTYSEEEIKKLQELGKRMKANK